MTSGKANIKDIIIKQIEINVTVMWIITRINFIPGMAILDMIALYNTYEQI